jgi:uncharacterized membrane protein
MEGPSVNTYGWLKLLHVLAAIVAVGTNVTYFVWLRRVKNEPAHDAFVLEGLQALDRRLANPAYILLPLTGIVMVLVGDLGFSTLWIATAIGLYVAMAVFAGIFFSPSLRKQLQLAQTDGPQSTAYTEASRRTTLTGGITMALIAAILYLMVIKPA